MAALTADDQKVIGQAVTNDRASYQYLVESIRRFPPQKDFADLITTAGFKQVKWRDMGDTHELVAGAHAASAAYLAENGLGG